MSPPQIGGDDRQRGRPRDASLSRSVLDAAATVLATQGYRALTMDELARVAGTTKTAIYRRWSSRTAVIVDLLAERLPQPTPVEYTGDPTADLMTSAGRLADALADPVVSNGLTGLLADAAGDPEVATPLRERLVDPQIAAAEEAVATAKASGAAPEWLTAELLTDVLGGAVLQHVVVRGQVADQKFLNGLATLLVSAVRP